MPKLTNIKPISYFKANAAEMLLTLRETGEPYIITQNGEAAAVLMDVSEYEKMQESIALLQIVSMSTRQFQEGKTVSLTDAATRVKKTIDRLKK